MADNHNHLIRKIDPSGTVTTLAGRAGVSGSADGQGTAASFNRPYSIVVDSSGNLYVADTFNHLIRKIDSSGTVTTLAGRAGVSGSADGQGTAASFFYPTGIALDSSGNLYVTDIDNHLIRRIDPSGNVTTLAGQAGVSGTADGQGTAASFTYPNNIALDSSGNLYVVGNQQIRKLTGVVDTETTSSNLDTPVMYSATGGAQQVTVTWSAVPDATYYELYWKQGSNPTTYDDVLHLDDVTSYVHAGLNSGETYHYMLIAGNQDGKSNPSNFVSAVPSDFSKEALNADNDADLLVYYDFNYNLNDSRNIYGDGRYNLTNTGGIITFAGSRFTGNQAAYFDADSGYLYNDYVNETDIPQLSGDFTISVWVNPSQGKDRASIVSTGDDTFNGTFQIDNAIVHHLTGSLYSSYPGPGDLELNTWHHVALIKKHTDDSTEGELGTLYINGVAGSSTSSFVTFFEKLKIGINRRSFIGWVGYVDEFKIYSRALTASEVSNLYNNDTPSSASGTSPWSGVVQLGTPSYDGGNDIVVNENGDVYVAGWSHGSLVDGTGGSAQDLAVLKYDSSGNRLWARQLEDPISTPYGIAIDASSNLYLVGETYNTSTSSDPKDLILLKYNSDGSLEWTQQLGTNQKDVGNDVTVDSSGNIYVTGQTSGSFNALNNNLSNAGARDFFVAKYDDTGDLQWIQQLGTSADDGGSGIAADYHGNIYVVGETAGSFSEGEARGDIFVAKYDSDTGAMEWVQQLENQDADRGSDIALDGNGNVYVTGFGWDTDDLFIAKLDGTGNTLWHQQLEDAGSTEITKSSAIDPTGNIFVTGFNKSDLSSNDPHTYTGGKEAFVVKYDNNSALQWARQFGTSADEEAWGIAADHKGDVYVTGWTMGNLGSTNKGIMDLFVVKFGSDGVLQ